MDRRQHLALIMRSLATASLGSAVLAACSGGEAAPDVSVTLLDGRNLRLASLKGQVVMVNFWATSCSSCVQEMPQLVAAHQKLHDKGYTTVAVAMSYDDPAYVANFATSRQLPFTVALDKDGAAAKGFGEVRLTPTSFLLNKRGEIVKKYVGAPDFADFERLVGELLQAA